MKTIELSTGTLLVVDLPVECINGSVYDDAMGSWLLCYSYVGKLPSPGYQLLGHPSEITGEVWGKVVEVVSGWNSVLYYDYVTPCSDYRDIVDAAHKAPLQSGLSLCAAHNIEETDVLIFKHKNK